MVVLGLVFFFDLFFFVARTLRFFIQRLDFFLLLAKVFDESSSVP